MKVKTETGVELTPTQAVFFEAALLEGKGEEEAKKLAEIGEHIRINADSSPIDELHRFADFIAAQQPEELETKDDREILDEFLL